ncbi:MAG: transglycosylase SLT domain-containing protein [Betaproteobacteria bacterium]|nr:transglycosylase SLT domain-containing protein [Betaproteobacteria bacterium]
MPLFTLSLHLSWSRHAVVLLAALVWPGAAVLAQTDADFLTAKAAFERADRGRLHALAPKLERHVLAPYVAYWQLKLSLDEATHQSVRAYVDRYPGAPLAERLRGDWQKILAKRGDWTGFAREYSEAPGEDTELACYGIQFRRQRNGEGELAAARALWFSGQTTPEACEPLFAELKSRGDLTVADSRARVRLASEAGNVRLAQAIAGELPAHDRITEREFREIIRDPQRELAKGEFAWATAGGRELALFALERAARADAATARRAWVKWRDKLPLAERNYGNARLGFHAARQLHPSANDWFREAGEVTLPTEVHGWRARAALRAIAWDDVLAAIDSMPETLRQDAAWRYWRARSLAANAKHEDAKAIYGLLASETSFYGMLAADALGRPFAIPKSLPLVPSAADLAAFGARSDVQRAVKLAHLDLRIESQREWFHIVRTLPDDALLLAADYARRAGLYDRAINTADRTIARHDFALRYLTPFRDEFDAAARDHDVDVALLYSIARQESRFVRDIVSSAGASGLMQLMPATARWVAKQLGRVDYAPSLIADVDINTQFGAYYFKHWYERLDRMPALAAAAYNAGPGRAQAWRPLLPIEGAVWVETIPFNETRDYVKKVLANSMVYAHALSTPQQTLTARLGVVAPRSVVPAAPTTAH